MKGRMFLVPLQPRPQGFSLKKFFEEKALETRLIPLYHIFESENFRFPFLKKISLT